MLSDKKNVRILLPIDKNRRNIFITCIKTTIFSIENDGIRKYYHQVYLQQTVSTTSELLEFLKMYIHILS